MRNNIVFNNRGGNIINCSSPLSNNLTTNPSFVNASRGDFHLTSSSPAINAGVSLPSVPCDHDGNTRPGGSAYDIGAYEYGSSPASSCPKGSSGGGATPTPTTLPKPAITLSATPGSLSVPGTTATLLWTVSNATSCTASGSWSGSKSPQGGLEVVNPQATSLYTLSCTGPGGSAQQSATITIGTSGPCHRYAPGSPVPSGFGVPWDVQTQTLLLKATCSAGTVLFDIGDASPATYIYKTAYTALSGASGWTSLGLFGSTLVSNSWYTGSATGIVAIPDAQLANPAFYVGYTCKWTGTTWKCGCRDQACAQSYWQIQSFKR